MMLGDLCLILCRTKCAICVDQTGCIKEPVHSSTCQEAPVSSEHGDPDTSGQTNAWHCALIGRGDYWAGVAAKLRWSRPGRAARPKTLRGNRHWNRPWQKGEATRWLRRFLKLDNHNQRKRFFFLKSKCRQLRQRVAACKRTRTPSRLGAVWRLEKKDGKAHLCTLLAALATGICPSALSPFTGLSLTPAQAHLTQPGNSLVAIATATMWQAGHA